MDNPSFAVVGIGASAGGVEALTALFRRLPPQTEAAFIVVTHLAPDRDSLMPEIIGRVTKMPTMAARDGEPICPGHVYLNSPDTVLTTVDGHLDVKPRHDERNPVDILLGSLARDFGERAIGVILSGTGTDGAVGLKAVREGGGMTFAQGRDDGSGPGYSGMPEAAIGTGYVDRVLSIEALADGFAGFVAGMGMRGPDAATVEECKTAIFATLQQRTGHDFSRYKDKTFLRRVERRMRVCQIDDLSAYVQLIKTDTDEAEALFRDLLINVTAFFRDAVAFDRLGELVLPKLLEGKGQGDSVRVWVAGCATGEEVYSLAILLREQMDRIAAPPRLQIFATDIDEDALGVARLGRYPANVLEGVLPARLARFFVRDGENYTISPDIRECCLFSPHNIFRDPPFSQIDLVSCRNLLIYFNADLQSQVIPLFHYALRPGGFLFLGSAENLTQHGNLFVPVDKKHRIYLRKDIPGRLPVLPVFATGGSRPSRASLTSRPAKGDDAVRHLERCVLERYAPAHVLVNRDGDVIHFSARTGKYLEAPAGAPTRNLLALARGGLNLPLRSAMREVQETGRPALRENVAVHIDGGIQTVDIALEPLPEIDGQPYWVILFTDVGPVRSSEDIARAELSRAADRDGALLHLEQDLQQTRERLQTTVEEYETAAEELKSSNEELVSLNEELQSSNEELEASKEELQSINEEMVTVNAELASKVDELDRASADLRNLLDITRIATVFLDEKLTIRSFTPAMVEIFKLIPNDRGRSLADIVSLIDYDNLAEDVHAVVGASEPIERQVVRKDGSAHYLMRIVPYQTMYDKVNGAIITYLDVTDMVHAEERQRLLAAELNHRVKNILSVVASMAGQMARRCTSIGEFTDSFIGRIEGLAKTHDILSAKEWSDVDLGELLQAELDAFVLEGERACLNGPEVALRPREATTLGIVIHELATNAVKYGAFSNRHGKLMLDWTLERRDGGRLLVLVWAESGGPSVRPPERTGLGSELIKRSLSFELGGHAEMDYRPEGLVVTLVIPLTEQNIRHAERTDA